MLTTHREQDQLLSHFSPNGDDSEPGVSNRTISMLCLSGQDFYLCRYDTAVTSNQ